MKNVRLAVFKLMLSGREWISVACTIFSHDMMMMKEEKKKETTLEYIYAAAKTSDH